MAKNKDTAFGDTLKNNSQTYQMFYTRLCELATNMHEWKGLPLSIDVRYLEVSLMSQGHALFFMDDVLKEYLALRCTIAPPFDIYMIGRTREAFSANGYHNTLSEKNSVIIFNNYMRTGNLLDIEMYAQRLYDIQRAIDVNVKLQKHMKMLLCSEDQRLVVENILKNYEGNVPVVVGSKNIDISTYDSLDISAPFVADKLQILKRQIWNEALTYLGIENSNTEKKERLVSTEVDTNLGGVEAQRFTRLNARREAAKKINAMFGLNISVDYREEKKHEAPEGVAGEGEEDE